MKVLKAVGGQIQVNPMSSWKNNDTTLHRSSAGLGVQF
jgi:hypothetical protein